MKQFSKILGFELRGYFTNKVFVGVTIVLIAVLIAVMFFPRVTDMIDSISGSEPGGDHAGEPEPGGDDVTVPDDGAPVMLLAGDGTADAVRDAFAGAFYDYNIKTADENDVQDAVRSGDAECAFVFDSLTSYTYYVGNLSMYDFNTTIADEVLISLYRTQAMMAGGMSEDAIADVMSAYVEHSTETLGVDQIRNYIYTYVMIIALYMVILIYGQMVASNVASEKSSRAMELLVTSADPVSMMFGKVLASCIAGLCQLTAVFGTAIICFNLNRVYWDEGGVMASIFDMPPLLFFYMLLFFVLGFLVYAFMYGAVGSMASKIEDLNTLVMPVTLVFVAAYIIVIIALASSNVDTLLMRISSYVPFTSPMAMFTRIAMSTVPVYEIVISVVILIASVFGIGFISAKIYRLGVLLYGTPPKPSAIIKALRQK